MKNLLWFSKALLIIGLVSICNSSIAQDGNMGMPDISGWPKASQLATKMMMDKYDKPNESTPHMLIWYKNGPGKEQQFSKQKANIVFLSIIWM